VAVFLEVLIPIIVPLSLLSRDHSLDWLIEDPLGLNCLIVVHVVVLSHLERTWVGSKTFIVHVLTKLL